MNARGFTLVEMLVAMAIFALVALAASSLLGVSLRSTESFARADAATRELQVARTIMRADFAQIARRPVRDAYGAPNPAAFAGGPPSASEKAIVMFVRHGWDNPSGDPRSSLQYVEYAVSDGALVRRSRPFLDATPETPVTTATILSDVSAARISFFFNGAWGERWISAPPQSALPDAVAFEVTVGAFGFLRQVFLVGDA